MALPFTLLIGNIVRSIVLHIIFGDDTNIHVASGTQIVKDAGSNRVPNQLDTFFLLKRKK